jgi:NAD(P)-dependent dehydrogenase (short-subunit alcohol dehydrogenase family)
MDISSDTRVALVTGASGSIGRETALALEDRGWTVYGGARRPSVLNSVATARLRPVALDVTADESMRTAVERVLGESGRVDLLVNNAGYGLYVPLEELELDDLRKQFETNVIGVVRMSQLVLPAMRRQGHGRIVNIGSMGDAVITPMGGAYHATKFALEAISDVLRVEVEPFGIDLVLVQPGSVRTGFNERIFDSMPQTGSNSPYAAQKAGFAGAMARLERSSGMLSAADVARVIVQAARARRPRTRYKAGASAYALMALRRILPDRALDAVMRRGLALGASQREDAEPTPAAVAHGA